MNTVTAIRGDARALPLADNSVHCCVTSPPYWGLRDYGHPGQLGLEATPQEYVENMVGVFREVRRVLRDDGTLWLNLGDSYANDDKWGGYSGGKHASALHGATGVGRAKRHTGLKPKNLVGIPWRVAFALQEDGWYLRSDIIWAKPNVMPSSVADRCTTSHEHVFMLSKSPRYYYDAAAIAEPCVSDSDSGNGYARPEQLSRDGRGQAEPWTRAGNPTRNKRDVWTVTTMPYSGAHFAVMPEKLVEPCVLAGCPEGGTVLDPFAGSGTVGVVATKHRRSAILVEMSAEYHQLIRERNSEVQVGIGL